MEQFSLADISEKFIIQNYIDVLSSTCEEFLTSALEQEDPSEGFTKAIENIIYKQAFITFFNDKTIEKTELTEEDLINAMFNSEGAYRFLVIMAKNGSKNMLEKYKYLFELQIEDRPYEWEEIQSIIIKTLKGYLNTLND